MEWVAHRMFEGGRVIPKLRQWAQPMHGRLVIEEQRDIERGRSFRVARLITASGSVPAPMLWDVQLVASSGQWLTLAGFERVAAGPPADTVSVAQAWRVRPAVVDALERSEGEVRRLQRLLAQAQGALAAGGASKDV